MWAAKPHSKKILEQVFDKFEHHAPLDTAEALTLDQLLKYQPVENSVPMPSNRVFQA